MIGLKFRKRKALYPGFPLMLKKFFPQNHKKIQQILALPSGFAPKRALGSILAMSPIHPLKPFMRYYSTCTHKNQIERGYWAVYNTSPQSFIIKFSYSSS